MKKIVALLVVFGLLLGVAGVYSADAAAKKVAKKVAKKAVKKAAPKKVAPKKAAPVVAPVAPVPPPPPVAPAPVVRPVVAAEKGIFGLGWNACLNGSYISTGKGSLGGILAARGDFVLADPLSLGSLVGLSADSVMYKLGAGFAYGNSLKAIPVYADAVVKVPAAWVGGLDSYVGGGLNYVIYGSGQTSGRLGIQAYAGANVDAFGLGKAGIELGYTAIRTKSDTAKGVSLGVTVPLVL